MRFKKKRNHGDADFRFATGVLSGLIRRGGKRAQGRTDVRKENGFQIGARARGVRRGESGFGEPAAVDAAIGSKDSGAEARDQRRDGFAARRFQFMDDIVGIQKTNAKFPEELGKRAFAAGDSACQGNLHLIQLWAGAGVAPSSLPASLLPSVFWMI